LFPRAGLTAEDDPCAILAPTQYRMLAEVQVRANSGELMESSLRSSQRRDHDDIRHATVPPDESNLAPVGRPRRERIGGWVPGQAEWLLPARLHHIDVVIVS